MSSPEDRKASILSLYAALILNLRAIADAIGEADRAGDDLSWFPIKSILDTLRKIGSGQVDADMAGKFLFSGSVFYHLKRLPLADQQRIAKTGAVEVVLIEDGKRVQRMLPVDDLSESLVKQVFRDGQIRTVQAQIVFLDERAKETPPDPYEEAVVVKKLQLEFTKAEWREIERRAERAGGLTALVSQAVRKTALKRKALVK